MLFHSQGEGCRRIVKDTIPKIIFPDCRTALRLRGSFFRRLSREPSGRLRNYCGALNSREVFLADCYFRTQELFFEGIVTGQREPGRHLTAMYGDFMTLLPEEKRIPHHFVERIESDLCRHGETRL